MGVERLHTAELKNLRLPDCEGSTSFAHRRPLQRLASSPAFISEMESSECKLGVLPHPHPKKTGVVSMMHPTPSGKNIKLRVRLSVHHSYAVVSPDKEVTRDLGYVNLRRSSVERIKNTNAFQIVPQDCDANALTFYVNQENDLADWMDSLRGDENTSHLLRRTHKPQGPLSRRWSAPVETFMPVIEED